MKLYEQAAQEAQNAGGEPQGAKGKDNVVDADFEVVDDKNNPFAYNKSGLTFSSRTLSFFLQAREWE